MKIYRQAIRRLAACIMVLLPLNLVWARDLPNIVFLLADDLGYGDLGCYNLDSRIPTINLDRLGEQGMRFTDAHSPSGVCTPTRYAVLTGRYCWRTPLKTGVLQGNDPPLIEEERLTVADLLRQVGYTTAKIGKWHLGYEWPLLDGNRPPSETNIDWLKPLLRGEKQQGFDYSFGLGKPGWTFMENGQVEAVPTEAFDMGREAAYLIGGNNIAGYRAPSFSFEQMLPRFTEEAVDFIGRASQSDRPFFLFWTPIAPHKPVVPNREFQGSSEAELYGDFVVELDDAVGRILQALEDNGVAENTLVVFTSDNGPENIAYDRIQETGHYSMANWRGVKRDLWEGGNRVPFIARWPGQIKAGTVSDETVSLVDFMATAAAIVNVDLPNDAAEDSYDILPVLQGSNVDEPVREATVYHGSNGKLAIRQGDWVLIDAETGMVSKEPEWFRESKGVASHNENQELFNLRSDPQQTRNVLNEHPQVAQRLNQLLVCYIESGRSVRQQRK